MKKIYLLSSALSLILVVSADNASAVCVQTPTCSAPRLALLWAMKVQKPVPAASNAHGARLGTAPPQTLSIKLPRLTIRLLKLQTKLLRLKTDVAPVLEERKPPTVWSEIYCIRI